MERYELLYQLELVAEATIDGLVRDGEWGPRAIEAASRACDEGLGRPMALDHRRILATALGRIRGKLAYRPVVFELVPETFTLLQLQRVVEALSGGVVKMGPGTLYTTIQRAEEQGLIRESDERPPEAEDQPQRRYYELTEFGRSALSAEVERLGAFVDHARAALTGASTA